MIQAIENLLNLARERLKESISYSGISDAVEDIGHALVLVRHARRGHDMLLDIMEDLRWHDNWGRYPTAKREKDRIRFYDQQEQRWFEIVVLPSEDPE